MDGDSTFLVLDLPWDDIVFSKILPRLEFRDCFNLMNSSEKFHKLVIAYFNQLKKLKTADFINLKDEESEFLGNNTGALKVLDFTDLPIHVEILKLFLANNRQLMHVALPSTKITDTDLYNLIHCQDLRTLNVNKCPHITDAFAVTVKFHCPYVDVTNEFYNKLYPSTEITGIGVLL